MLMENYIKQLKKTTYDNPGKVFSLYLNTDPRDSDNQKGGKWKIVLKKALNDLEEKAKDSAWHEEKNQAKDIRNKIEEEIYGNEDKLKRSIILFGTADGELWFSQSLNIPVTNEFHWENQPNGDQLEKLVAEYPHTLVLVLQQSQAMLIETEVGTVLDNTYYQLDLNTDEWREHQGPQGADWAQSGTKKDEYQERVKAHQQRWFKSLAENVQKKAKQKELQNIQLVGEKEEVDALRKYFDWDIDKVVAKNLLGRNPSEILADITTED